MHTYFKVWNAGDMEGVRELHDPDAVMEAVPDWPEPGPFVGRTRLSCCITASQHGPLSTAH